MLNQNLQILKNKFDIIGNDPALNRALEVAVAVAPTDITVLVIGESGVGKENIPKIVHYNSRRKTNKYFAVNCGAIPEGTIDSELFGHEKGAFTGANEMRRGYFEEADGGTLFLDEIGELPMASQAKLLRVLQSGEFVRVGSSKVLKTDVRVIAATNMNLLHAVNQGKFREDLYYRLNAVTINVPSLRERQGDIHLLFRKFASDFAEKYGLSGVSLSEDAILQLKKYRWPGNIRQLKNVAESVCILESSGQSARSGKREIDGMTLLKYIPKDHDNLLPMKVHQLEPEEQPGEREMLIRTVFQLKQDVDYLKEIVTNAGLAGDRVETPALTTTHISMPEPSPYMDEDPEEQDGEESHEVVTIEKSNLDLIRQTLQKYNGNRKKAAEELAISERTLYRKIKQMENSK